VSLLKGDIMTTNNNTELSATFTSTEINILSQLINGAFSSNESREAAIQYMANRLSLTELQEMLKGNEEPKAKKLVEYSLSECDYCEYIGNVAIIDVEENQDDYIMTRCDDCNSKYRADLEEII